MAQTAIRRLLNNFRTYNKIKFRNSSYEASPFLCDLEPITRKYEKTNNPEEWKYVERLLPLPTVPEPPKKDKYPSGWKPQSENLGDRPYFIARTKNHMIPVYLVIKSRNQLLRLTVIRKIQGNIWLLEKELRPFLEDYIKPKPLRLQVHEFAGKIVINGDVVNAVKHWLEERNF